MKKVLIPTKLDQSAYNLLRDENYCVVQDSETDLENLVREHPDTNALIVRSEKITQVILDKLPELRLIVRAGAGYNTIDTSYARLKDIDVMNTPGANSNAVAEEVVALFLAAYRHIVPADSSTRNALWEKKKFMGREISGKVMGIVGLGNIGRLVVKRLEGFEIEFMVYDPFVSSELANDLGVELASLEEIFTKADCISLHIPETPQTKGLVNSKLLRLMKPDSILINCARAGVISEVDLREVKKEKNIVFCNDVYPKDTAGEKSVTDIADIMLPHLGASTFEANFTAAKMAGKQVINYFDRGISNYIVNKSLPDGLDVKYQELALALAKLARHYLGTERSPHEVNTSFYGSLKEYKKWLLAAVTAGICTEFDAKGIYYDPESYLKNLGITFCNRDIDDSKPYADSITIDLFEGNTTINKVSVRGTITEGNLMISRINEFDKLYLDPRGYNLFVEYEDRPGIIGKIASLLGDSGINILDIRAPQDNERKNAIMAIKADKPIADDQVKKIKDVIDAKVAFFFHL